MDNQLIKPIRRQSLKNEVYEHLKKAIVMLELPPGERVNDKELAEKFGISRTPVREALKRLEEEGLVESLPSSSTRVAPLHLEEAKHAFIVVAALHALAARLAAPSVDGTALEKMEASNRLLQEAIGQGDVVKAIEADSAFHQVFVEGARNPELTRALERSTGKIQRLEMSQFSAATAQKSVVQHERIIAACKAGKQEEIVRLVEENWLSLGELLTEQIK